MNRRNFIKSGVSALAGLQLGEVISLAPNTLYANEIKTVQRFNTLANHIKDVKRVESVCLNCSIICGMTVLVKDDEILGVEGKIDDPNAEGTLCAKAHGGVSAVHYSERIVYPLKRVGKRGEGLWERITMEEAYSMMASRIKRNLDNKTPERVVFHAGRNKMGDITGRFMDAIGSPVILNHRALCSSNKRAANYSTIGDTDWETIDARNCKYFLNFGSNFLETHQGGFHLLKRYIEAKKNGAKLVTLDTRLSNTAGRSDEWLAPYPASEGAVALAMANVIIEKKLYDKEFIDEWCNTSFEEIVNFVKPYTPEFAAKISGLDAKDIERIAIEFASKAPHCAAFTNRGSQAHYNGLNNDRSVIMLNAIVGSIGKIGGYTFGGSKDTGHKSFPMPEPIPPKPGFSTDLEDPKLYPLANKWQKMKVSELVFDKIRNKTQKIDVYMSYTISAPQTWPEGPDVTVEVLKSEELIPFHVCSDVVYSEMAHYADLILPDATYFERYTIEARNAYELIPYFALRQPAVKLPFDCENFADTLIKVGKRLGKDISQYFAFDSYEEFIKLRFKDLPIREELSGFDYMKKHGIWLEDKEKNFEPYKIKLKEKELIGSVVEDGIIYKIIEKQKKEAIGLMKNNIAYRGLKTPSRKFEIFSSTIKDEAQKLGIKDDGFPHFIMPKSLKEKKNDELVLTTFKWNVHTQARTTPQKYLTEIVHDNPMWINTKTAEKYDLKNGDFVELTSYRPKEGYKASENEIVGKMDVKIFITEGIHPEVIAISNSLGMNYGGRIPQGKNKKRDNISGYPAYDDLDLNGNIWWDKSNGGAGNGFNPNYVIPINPSPLVGMQSWNDTICKIKKI